MAKTTTVILGAGFGGISTANVLRSKLHSEHRIVLVDRAKRFVVGAGQTWVMLGQKAPEEISLPLDGLARRGIEVVTSEVTAIDPVTRTVTLEGRKLQADHLVLALGAHLNLDAVPGLAAAAHSFYTLDGALELQRALSTFKGGNLVVSIPRTPFKCPPAPYEGALLLADHFAKLKRRKDVALSVYTVEGAPMTTAGPEMGQFVRGLLAEAGIALHTQQKLVRVNPEARTLSFEGGAAVPFDLLVAVPPHEAPKVVREAGLVGESGWIPVDPKTLAQT
ncbi:MAG: NAD(P)/FAD-dependent oxidoreductase [Archangiaceae bacterium]|nr:NAD(P)/FAD-dependent oxidoreductase [Archangiaceae bacterium]